MSAVPQHPLLAPWCRLIEDGDRLLLEHGQAVVVLEGAAVRSFLPALLPLLDGTRSHDELVRQLGEPASPAVDLALETLAAHDLLVEGPDLAAGPRDAAYSLAAAFDLAPATAAGRLADASILVTGSSPAAAEVARLLRASGAGQVVRNGSQGTDRSDLAVVAPAAPETGTLEAWNRSAMKDGGPWLPVLPYDGRFAGVGPLIVPGESCCFECVLRRRAANLEYGAQLGEIERVAVAATADPAAQAFTAALAAHLALRWVVGRDLALPGVLYTLEARPALALEGHPVLRVPRCPVCSPAERVAAPLPWHAASGGEEMPA